MYHWTERESEVELEIEDTGPEAVFNESLVALGELLGERRGKPVTHEVEAAAADLPGLLAEWMKELVFLCEVDGFFPERMVKLRLEGSSLRATVAGERSEPRGLIKAVAHREVELRRNDEGEWIARVILHI